MSKPSGYRQVICFAYDSGINITFIRLFSYSKYFCRFYTKDMIVGIGNSVLVQLFLLICKM
jgi:hypothetical protein